MIFDFRYPRFISATRFLWTTMFKPITNRLQKIKILLTKMPRKLWSEKINYLMFMYNVIPKLYFMLINCALPICFRNLLLVGTDFVEMLYYLPVLLIFVFMLNSVIFLIKWVYQQTNFYFVCSTITILVLWIINSIIFFTDVTPGKYYKM